jgi:hypothetical protein
MHVTLQISAFPEPAVFRVTKKCLPSAALLAYAYFFQVFVNQRMNPFAIGIPVNTAILFHLFADQFSLVPS